jgi:hypothetical protein
MRIGKIMPMVIHAITGSSLIVMIATHSIRVCNNGRYPISAKSFVLIEGCNSEHHF